MVNGFYPRKPHPFLIPGDIFQVRLGCGRACLSQGASRPTDGAYQASMPSWIGCAAGRNARFAVVRLFQRGFAQSPFGRGVMSRGRKSKDPMPRMHPGESIPDGWGGGDLENDKPGRNLNLF